MCLAWATAALRGARRSMLPASRSASFSLPPYLMLTSTDEFCTPWMTGCSLQVFSFALPVNLCISTETHHCFLEHVSCRLPCACSLCITQAAMLSKAHALSALAAIASCRANHDFLHCSFWSMMKRRMQGLPLLARRSQSQMPRGLLNAARCACWPAAVHHAT